MIVSPLPETEGTVIITQTDHARLSAEILSLWRTDGLPEHPFREELLFAVREHDNGWAEIDSAPRVDADGKPHDFTNIPASVRREIWRTGVLRYAESRPLAALWIVLHALHLHERHAGKEEWRPSFELWRRLEKELREATDVPAAAIDEGYLWVDLLDTISLAACDGWTETSRSRGFEIRPRKTDGHHFAELVVDPFPLAGSTVFEVGARILDRRTFSGDGDLGLALASSRWTRLRIRIAPEPIG